MLKVTGRLGSFTQDVYLLVGRFLLIAVLGVFWPSTDLEAQWAEDSEGLASPLDLNLESREWARRVAAQSGGSGKRRLERIRQAMLDPRGLGLREIPSPTPTAEEAFVQRRSNCVGFAFLFVAVAREAGIPAFFAVVEDRRVRRPEGGLRLVEEHLTAAARIGDVVWLVDFAGVQDGRKTRYRALADIGAIAIYHSNRGVEHLLAGSAHLAVAALETSVALEPTLVSPWINLGVARRWAKQWAGAERAYRTALDLDPTSPVAARNLAVLLELDGRPEEAGAVRRESGPLQQSDPFALLNQAKQSLASGELEDARRLYARALAVSAR